MNIEWDQLEVVKEVTGNVPQDFAMRCVSKGWQNLHEGQPISEFDPVTGVERPFDVANILRTDVDEEMSDETDRE